jgi:hypothetical protein
MAAVDDTAAMIDYLVLRWKKSGTTARATLLQWVQDAEDSIWNADDFWFSRDEQTLTWTSGSPTLAAPSGTAQVIHIVDHNGVALDHVPYPTFSALYRSDTTSTAAPQVWTVDYRDKSTGVLTMRFWPKPNSAYAGKITRKIAQNTLTDSSGSSSYVPREYRTAHLYYALWLMAEDEGQSTEAQLWKGRYDEVMNAMRDENMRQRGEVAIR